MSKIKTFKRFVVEAPIKEPGKEKEVERVRDRQSQEKDSLKDRQEAELDNAREQDFQNAQDDREKKQQNAENQRRAKESAKNENADILDRKKVKVLEVGTNEIVKAYKSKVPGQDK